MKLAEELGLQDKIVRNATGQSYMLVKNKLHKMPKGIYMGVPKKVGPLLSSKLISPRGKIRALADLFLPRGKQEEDQSLGAFFRRRFGDQLIVNQIEPLLSGIHSGDIDEMSLEATYPIFHELEQTYGSVMKGLRKTIPESSAKKGRSTGAFFSFEGGLSTLIDRLEDALEPGTIMPGTAVDHVEKKEYGYHVLLSNGEVYGADAVMMTTPHFTLPKVFSQYDFFKAFQRVPATSTANVVLAFDASAIKKDIDGTGFLVSRSSNYRITACTWTHKKWPHTAPEGKALLRSYVGRPGDEAVVDLPDEELTGLVMDDLKKTMKLTAQPEFSVVTRWKDARPQYTVGHLRRLEAVREDMLEQLPGVFAAGSSFDGVGIPDCIEQGEKAVGDVLGYLDKA